MSNNKGRTPEKDWALSVWQWSLEVEEAHGLPVQISIYRTSRKGVLGVQLRAVEVVDGRPTGVRTQVRGEYPNGQATNFLAFLGVLFATLDAELTDYRKLAGL